MSRWSAIGPPARAVVWTGVSIIMLLAGICAMVWWYASQSQERPRAGPRNRPDSRLEGHAVTTSDGQVFLARVGHDPRANLAGRRHGPLRRRGRRLLRHPSLEVAALQRDSDVASATRRALDCDGVAGRWPVHRAAGERIGTQGPEARRQSPVRCLAGGRGRVDGRAVVEHPEPSLADRFLLLRPSGVRVHRPGPSLADRTLRRLVALVGSWSCEWSFQP